MSSHFVSIMEWATTNSSLLLSIALCIVLIYTFYLDHKIVVLTRGESGASLEKTIKACLTSVTEIEKRNDLITQHAEILDEKISHTVRNAQTVRYKAYDVNGSNQSFSVALLNEKGNGVIISSLHAHDRMSTFAKPIEKYESNYDLTEEELAVLEDSKNAHKKAHLHKS